MKSNIVFSIVTGVIGSIIASIVIFFWGIIELKLGIIVSLFLLVLYLLYLIIRLNNNKLLTIKNVGIYNILTMKKHTIDHIIKNADYSFLFWGISAKRTTSNPEIVKKIIEIGKRNGEIKFLLFNPRSAHFKRKAEDEGDNPESWRKEITATVSRLKQIAKKHNINIQVRFFDKFPIWRVLVLDYKIIYLNYFQTGKQGPQSPQIILEKNEDSLYNPIYLDFFETWDNQSIEA